MLAFRWRIFLRQQEIALPFRTVFSLTWAGQFFNSILPGSTGGDLVKIYQICRLAPERKAAAVSTVFVDRLSALLALLVLVGGSLLVDPKPLLLFPFPAFSFRRLFTVGLVVLLGGLIVLWTVRRFLRATRLEGRIFRTLAAARNNLVLNVNLVLAVILAFGIHLCNFTILYFFARALGLPISYNQILLMMPVILFIVLIPITINGHGLRELLLIGYFRYMGIVVAGPEITIQDTAVALSLVAVANDLLWSLPGGLLYFVSLRSWPKR